MAIALVGQVTNAAFATTCVATRTTTAANCLVAMVQHTGRTSISIADSAGNTWTLAATTNTSGSTSERLMSMYYCLSANSVTSVTVSNASTTALVLNVTEWTGVTALRAAAQANITSGSATIPVAATAADLVIGQLGYFSTGGTRLDTLAATWTRLTDGNISSTVSAFAYKIATSTASQGPSWTGVAATAGVITAAFSGPVTNTPPTVTPPAAQRIATGSTAILTMTATDPDGTLASASWANTSRPAGASAPTLTPSGSPSGITVTTSALTAPGTYTFTPSATDNSAATTTGAIATVYVYAADKSAKVDSVSFGSSGWTGTAADVSDGSDTTYAQGPVAPVAPASRAIFRMKPIADGDLTITKMRLRLDPTVVGGAAETCTVEVLNGPGDTVIATRSGINVTTTSFVDFASTPIALTGPENTAFTNHSVWAIALTPNQ